MARITPDVPQRGAASNLLNVIDTYYRPARDRVGESALSQGLNAASNVASTMSSRLIQRDVEEAERQAKADAASGLDPDAELTEVRLGNIFRPQSRAYNQVYNEAMGQKAGMEFNQNLTLEYERSGLKRNTNPEAFRTWMNERVHGFLNDPENQNEYFLSGAVGVVQQQAFNMGAAHMGNVSRQMERNHIAAVQRRASEFVMGMVRGERTQEEVIEQLSGLNNQAYGTGLSGPTSRRAILSAYLSVADATDNADMITALLGAQEGGTLNLTPEEWNGVTEQGIAIERDINFRQTQIDRAQTRQRTAEMETVTDVVSDFYSAPENTGVPLAQFLTVPVGENGETMGEMIANSPNTTALMSQVKSAHETMNTVFEIGTGQSLANDAMITAAFHNGEINNASDLVSWMDAQQQDGNRFSDDNLTTAYGMLASFTDPESSYGTQAFKDNMRPTLDRIVGALSAPDSVFSTLSGEYAGGMSDDIELRFGEYVAAAFAQIPNGRSQDNTAVRDAIAQAEQATMDYYRETDPYMFEERRNRFAEAVNNNEISITSNPALMQETLRLEAEQEAYDAKQTALAADANLEDEDRADLAIQAGEALLGLGGENPENPEAVVPDPEVEAVVPDPSYNGDMPDYDLQLLRKTLSDAANDPNLINNVVPAFERRYGNGAATEILEQLGITYPATPEAVTPEAVTPEAVTPEAVTPEAVTPEPEFTGRYYVNEYDQKLLLDTLSGALNDPDVISQTVEAFEARYGVGAAFTVLEQLGITNN